MSPYLYVQRLTTWWVLHVSAFRYFSEENVFFRTFVRGRPPTVAPRNINLFFCNKFRLRRERRPLAEGPKNMTNMFFSVTYIVTRGFGFGMKICVVRICNPKAERMDAKAVAEGALA